MTAFQVLYAKAAQEDIKQIYRYIAFSLREPETAKQQIRRIRSGIRSLQNFPYRFSCVEWEPWHSMAMHRMPVDRYLVFYLCDRQAKTVTIVLVFYGGRDIAAILNNEQA